MAKTFTIITAPTGLTGMGTISSISFDDSMEFGVGKDASGNVDTESDGARTITCSAEVEYTAAITAILAAGATLAADWDGNGSVNFKISKVTRNETNDSTAVNTVSVEAHYHVPT